MAHRYFESTKIYFGSNFGFAARIKLVSAIMSSKAIRGCLKDKLFPLYTIYEGSRIDIGYVKDLRGKVLARSVGESKVHVYADLQITTDNEEILKLAKTHIEHIKCNYRLMFVARDIDNHPDHMINGMIISFNV